jgi:hypothetical protein
MLGQIASGLAVQLAKAPIHKRAARFTPLANNRRGMTAIPIADVRDTPHCAEMELIEAYEQLNRSFISLAEQEGERIAPILGRSKWFADQGEPLYTEASMADRWLSIYQDRSQCDPQWNGLIPVVRSQRRFGAGRQQCASHRSGEQQWGESQRLVSAFHCRFSRSSQHTLQNAPPAFRTRASCVDVH